MVQPAFVWGGERGRRIGEGTVKTKRNLAKILTSALIRRGWVRKGLTGGLLFLGVSGVGSSAWAQMPTGDMAASKLPDKSFMAKNALYLPVLVDERARASLREI